MEALGVEWAVDEGALGVEENLFGVEPAAAGGVIATVFGEREAKGNRSMTGRRQVAKERTRVPGRLRNGTRPRMD
ncbi:hypothetical protein DIPPA_18338 [Diplonema papillatum]|nr:hypothetical protein DIPPA_18338 [Diplonema papillatum]